MGRWVAGLLAATALIVAVGGGCSKKKGDLDTAESASGAPLGEEALPGRGGSLDQARSGTLGSGAGGPLTDIPFDYDSYDISSEARQILQQNADWLSSNRGARVEIEGHCDQRGTVEYNLALGAKRASAAKSYLESLGIAPDRLTTVSYGEELPLCHEETESCWAENRRDHFVVLAE